MTDSNLVTEMMGIVRKYGRIPSHVVITPESRLVEDLAIDSLDLVNAVLKIQDQFDVVIEDEDMSNLRRVVDLANYVGSRRGSAAA